MDLELDLSQKLPWGWSYFIPEVEEHFLRWIYRNALCVKCGEGHPRRDIDHTQYHPHRQYRARCRHILDSFRDRAPKDEKEAIEILQQARHLITRGILSYFREPQESELTMERTESNRERVYFSSHGHQDSVIS